jgi:hypothetical protein
MVKQIGDKQKYVLDKYQLIIKLDKKVTFDRKYNRLKDICDDINLSYSTIKNINNKSVKYDKKYKHITINKIQPVLVDLNKRIVTREYILPKKEMEIRKKKKQNIDNRRVIRRERQKIKEQGLMLDKLNKQPEYGLKYIKVKGVYKVVPCCVACVEQELKLEEKLEQEYQQRILVNGFEIPKSMIVEE